MEKRFLIFTSPMNERIIQKTGAHFYDKLSDMWEEKITRDNSSISYDLAIPCTRIHLFDKGEYIGWLAVIDERTASEAASTRH